MTSEFECLRSAPSLLRHMCEHTIYINIHPNKSVVGHHCHDWKRQMIQPGNLMLHGEWDLAQEQQVGTGCRKSKKSGVATWGKKEPCCVWYPHRKAPGFQFVS